MVTLVNIMVMNGWLTSFSFHVNRPSHSWDKAIWAWSKGKVIQSTQYPINSLHFYFTPISPNFLRYSYFEIWAWNIQGQGHEVKGEGHILYPIFNRCTFSSLHINRTNGGGGGGVVWCGVGWVWCGVGVVVVGWSGWWVAWGWVDGGGSSSTKYIFVSGKFFMYSIIRGMVYYWLIVHVRSVASYVSP